jgi:hypothetical protein
MAHQIALALGIDIDKDVARRMLSVHDRPESDSGGLSWLTFLGHTDQFTRRLIGLGLHAGIVDGVAL